MTNLFHNKKFLSALLLLAIIAAVSAFLLTARGNPTVASTDHSNVSGPAELRDLQAIAVSKGITLDEAIEIYAWRDDFSRMVTAIEEDDPDSIAEAASTSGSTALIRFSGSIPADAQRTIDDFEAENPNLTITKQTNVGYTEREYVEAVVGAYYSVMAKDGVKDGTAHFEGETNKIRHVSENGNPTLRCKASRVGTSSRSGCQRGHQARYHGQFHHIPVGRPEGFGRSGQRLQAHGRRDVGQLHVRL